MRRRKGFTLIELMIVMVIIAILLSLLLPGVLKGRDKAVKVKCQNNLRQCGIALYAYAGDYDGALPAPGGWATALTNNGYLDTNKVTRCPKNPVTFYPAKWSSGANLYTMSTSVVLLNCPTHNIDVYADGRVE